MILLEKTSVYGFEESIRGLRNPMNSWERSDTTFFNDGSYHTINGDSGPYYGTADLEIGPNDHDLMMRLAKNGSSHSKYRRMIVVYVDITAPLYLWREFDTYKIGTVSNSCSTMNRIHAKEFALDDFSHEHLIVEDERIWEDDMVPHAVLRNVIITLNNYRRKFLETGDKRYWWQMIQLLPQSYNQKRTINMNYEVLARIYTDRKNHKLDEWHTFCRWIDTLPYSEIITDTKEEI